MSTLSLRIVWVPKQLLGTQEDILCSGSVSGGASGARAPLDFSKGTTGNTLTEPLWHHHYQWSMAWEGLGTTQFEMLPEPLFNIPSKSKGF